MMTDVPVSTLVELVGADVVSLDPEVLASYRWDNAEESGAQTPLAVARPRDAGQVQEIVRWASRNRVPVVPRGAGSGLSGGAEGLDYYRAIAADARRLLASGGRLIVELGAGQEAAVRALFTKAGLTVAAARDDLAGIPRALSASIAT